MANDDISAGDAEMEHPHRDHGHQILCLCVWTLDMVSGQYADTQLRLGKLAPVISHCFHSTLNADTKDLETRKLKGEAAYRQGLMRKIRNAC